MHNHTGEKPCSCEVCRYAFAQKSHLMHHIWTHTGEKSFSCESGLVCHIQIHIGEKPYPYEVHGSAFSQNIKMWTHTGKWLHSCGHCGSAFSQKPSLAKHMWNQIGEKLQFYLFDLDVTGEITFVYINFSDKSVASCEYTVDRNFMLM